MNTRQTKTTKTDRQGFHSASEKPRLVLPDSTRTEAVRIAEREGISLTDFVMYAVAEKVARFELLRPLAKRQ